MTLTIRVTSFFTRRYRELTAQHQADFEQALQRFIDNPFDPRLRTHKLKGKWAGFWAFSINHSHRVLFKFSGKETVDLINVGDHSIYR